MNSKKDLSNIKEGVLNQKRILREINLLSKQLEKAKNPEEKNMISAHIKSLKDSLKKTGEDIPKELKKISVAKPLHVKKEEKIEKEETKKKTVKEKWGGKRPEGLERETLKRLKKKGKETPKKKFKKPSQYVNLSHKIFSNMSLSLSEGGMFKALRRNLVKANLQFVPESYISVIFFTTLVSFIAGFFVLIFFLFFNVSADWPIITPASGGLGGRFLKTFWILFVIPLATFLFMYFYPSMEKKSAENKINQELPFATIHMAAVSGSMIDPSNIFRIIIATGEYEFIGKEFTKLINEINVYGYNLVSALRMSAFNSPSKKLAELFNGLATTITSGGDLPNFFEKRAQTLLFEYRLDREKQMRTAETFMDIYISVVIAAPMIFMLLLMIIKISGLGITLGIGTIALIMVIGVATINVVFLTFLHLKQPGG